MLLSFHLQLFTHSIYEQKLHFITYKSVSLFAIRCMYTQSFEHLNKVGLRATMDSELEEQRSKFLLLEDEKLCHIFQRLQKSLSLLILVKRYSPGFHSFGRAGQA